jgi:signal transduction histidine kinase
MLEGVLERYKLSNLEQELKLDELEHRELYVIGDRGRMEQVIYNLINNAINHTEAGGHILLKVIDIQNTVRIEVNDDGEGIENEALSHVFERYYKGKDTERSKRSGTGLGLAIVKSILTMHQVPFGVRSSPGVGTTFWLELHKEKTHQSF